MGERSDMNRDQNDRSSEDIRRDIRRTQHDIGQTVDDIQYRLSPDRIMHQARDRMREAPRRASEGLMNKIKANPLPAAIAGLGLWMLFKGDSSRDVNIDYDAGDGRSFDYESYAGNRYPTSSAYGAGRGAAFDRESNYTSESKIDSAKERIGEAVDSAREKISDVASDMGERVHELSDSAAHAGDAAMRRAAYMGQRARYGTRTAMHNVSDFISSNPMILGAAGAVVGALLGFSIPETDRENELMGGARDNLKDRAVDMAHEGVQKARNVATAAADAATSTVKSELADQSPSGATRPSGMSASSGMPSASRAETGSTAPSTTGGTFGSTPKPSSFGSGSGSAMASPGTSGGANPTTGSETDASRPSGSGNRGGGSRRR